MLWMFLLGFLFRCPPGWGRVIHASRVIASPQVVAIHRGVFCLRKMASAVWGMTQHRDPGGYSVSSSSVVSPEPPTPDSSQASLSHSALPLTLCTVYVAENEILCVGSLRGSLGLQPFLSGRQNPCCFSQLDVIWVPFWLWCYRLGSPAWDLDLIPLRGTPCPSCWIISLELKLPPVGAQLALLCLPWIP